MLTQREQRIEFIYSFIADPEGICEEDWKIWRPIIARSCAEVMNEVIRKKGLEALSFFKLHFYGNTMRERGLEPLRETPLPPQSSASTNSATLA